MSSDNRLFLWMTLAMLFWGASWPIANVLSVYINEHEFVVYRYVITVLTMVPVLFWMKLSFKITIKQFLVASVTALLLIFYTKFYFLSTKYGAPGLAGAVVTTLMPIIVYILMLFSRQKHPSVKDWVALFVGAVGVLVTMRIWQFDVFNSVNVFLVLAASCWALMSVIASYAKSSHSAVLSFYIYIMVIVLDLIFFFEPTHGSVFLMDKVFWINMLIVSIGATTFATTVYFLGVQRLGSKQGSVFTFLVPFFSIGLSVIFLNESLHWTAIVGVLMTISSLKILNNIKLSFYNKNL